MTEFDPDTMVAVPKAQAKVYEAGMDVLNKLWGDPKEGLEFKRKVKKLKPDWSIPEVDVVDQAAAPFRAEIDGLKKTVEDLVGEIKTERKTSSEKRAELDLQASLDAARREYQLTDDGMEKVMARMKETGNPDPSSAAAWVTDHMPKAKPTRTSGFAPAALNLFGSKTEDAEWADLHKDPIGFFDNKTLDILEHPENYPELRGAA